MVIPWSDTSQAKPSCLPTNPWPVAPSQGSWRRTYVLLGQRQHPSSVPNCTCHRLSSHPPSLIFGPDVGLWLLCVRAAFADLSSLGCGTTTTTTTTAVVLSNSNWHAKGQTHGCKRKRGRVRYARTQLPWGIRDRRRWLILDWVDGWQDTRRTTIDLCKDDPLNIDFRKSTRLLHPQAYVTMHCMG